MFGTDDAVGEVRVCDERTPVFGYAFAFDEGFDWEKGEDVEQDIVEICYDLGRRRGDTVVSTGSRRCWSFCS